MVGRRRVVTVQSVDCWIWREIAEFFVVEVRKVRCWMGLSLQVLLPFERSMLQIWWKERWSSLWRWWRQPWQLVLWPSRDCRRFQELVIVRL